MDKGAAHAPWPPDRDGGEHPGGKRTLKADPRLARAGRLHALMVIMATPAAIAVAVAWILAFGLGWREIMVWGVAHLVGFTGVAVALHRYFAHRAFETPSWVRDGLAVLAMSAAEGSVSFWVADHRRHHRFADQDGDPHSPHATRGGPLTRFWHAHCGWMLDHAYANPVLFAPDILADRRLMRLNRLYPAWVLLGLIVPGVLGGLVGVAAGGSIAHGALMGFVWGGAVRLASVHQATFLVNSVGHLWGRRRFDTSEQSRNVAWLSIPTLGDSLHNNHHAFPGSARTAVGPGDFDLGFAVIACLRAVGLATNVRVPPRQTAPGAPLQTHRRS